MRSLLILMMFTVSLAHAAGNEYEEVRNLNLSAEGISTLEIEAGAGSLEVTRCIWHRRYCCHGNHPGA